MRIDLVDIFTSEVSGYSLDFNHRQNFVVIPEDFYVLNTFVSVVKP